MNEIKFKHMYDDFILTKTRKKCKNCSHYDMYSTSVGEFPYICVNCFMLYKKGFILDSKESNSDVIKIINKEIKKYRLDKIKKL